MPMAVVSTIPLFHISDESQAGPRDCGESVGVVAASGELDFGASPALRAAILRQIDAGRQSVVVDLSLVRFIDSTAIGVLLGALERLSESGGGVLAVACPEENERVMRIFDIAGVASLLELHATREQAIRALGAQRSTDASWQRESRPLCPCSAEAAPIAWPSVGGALRRYARAVAAGHAPERTGGVGARSRHRVDELA